MKSSVLGIECVDIRKNSALTAADRARVKAEVLPAVKSYLAIEEMLGMDSADWDKPFPPEGLSDLATAEGLAGKLRSVWGLGSDPIPDMVGLLEEHGIRVFVLPLPDDVSGVSCFARRSGNRPPVSITVVNRNHNVERRRSNTLGHELARRVIGRGSEVDRTKAANRFAGAFLVPREHLRAKVGNKRKVLQYDNLIRLKHLYRVSGACLLVRIQQVGILRKLRMFRVFEKGLRAWSAFEPEPLDDQGDQDQPQRFERLCRQALDEQLISPQTALELLDLPAKGAR